MRKWYVGEEIFGEMCVVDLGGVWVNPSHGAVKTYIKDSLSCP